MAIEVIMPKAGMAMEEGTIIKWLKAEGDTVTQGEPLLEILTDKVNMEVEAYASGTLLKILKQVGDVVPVTQVIAYLGEANEQIPQATEAVVPANTVSPSAFSSPANLVVPSSVTPSDAYDVVVIGGGPAGYVAALKAAQLGGKVALIEKDSMGGTCVNRGCIPTKTFLRNVEILDNLQHAASRGILLKSTDYSIDMNQVVQQKNDVVAALSKGVSGLLKSYKVKIIKGTAKITKDLKVEIDGQTWLETAKIILAGGSKPSRLNIPGMTSRLVLTSDEILDLKEIPETMTIIGGGVIGVELATVFQAYGSVVTIIEMEDRIVPFMDTDISTELTKSLKAKGIQIFTSTRLEKIDEIDNKLNIHTDKGVIEAHKALLSIGRVADLEAIGDMEIELVRGKIKVNDQMETSIPGLYAPGDINGRSMLAHAAYKMGEVAAANAMGHFETADLSKVPGCIYTLPEVGCVGLTEAAARISYDVTVGRFSFSANGRAMASGEWNGFVKVITDNQYGEILGVHIVGPSATELINEAAALMSLEITAHEAAKVIHGHPTFSEAFLFAVQDSIRDCIHKPKSR